VLDGVRRRIGRPVDVLLSDACLMQTVEVAAELAGTARFSVGSSQVQGYLGLPYRRVVQRLSGALGRPGAGAAGVGRLAFSSQALTAPELARALPAVVAGAFREGTRAGGDADLFTASAV